jgi:peroxiredoxin
MTSPKSTIFTGWVLVVAGLAITVVTYLAAKAWGGYYVLATGVILDGARRVVMGTTARQRERRGDGASGASLAPGWLGPAVQVGFVVAAAVLVYSFVAVAREAETRRKCSSICLLHPNYAGADRKMPSFTLSDMNGREVSSEAFRGKVLILNFWTKTCGPCLQEMPELVDLAKILRGRTDVALITISTDEGPNDVRDTLKSVLHDEAPFPILFDPESKVVAGKFGTHLFPETWIVDPRGVIRARFDGAREWSSSMVVELIEDLRSGGYCPVKFLEGKLASGGDAAQACKSIDGAE